MAGYRRPESVSVRNGLRRVLLSPFVENTRRLSLLRQGVVAVMTQDGALGSGEVRVRRGVRVTSDLILAAP